jgi:hypothetical protein
VTVTTRRTASHTYEHDDGRRFDLPIVDPYDNYIIDESMQVDDHVGGTQLRYVIRDEDGGSWLDQDELFYGWTDVHVLHSQRDADAVSALLHECVHCGERSDVHGAEGDEDGDLGHVWDHDWEPSDALKDLKGGRAFLFERYEHGQVRYGLRGETSAVDRQWDVTPIAGFMRADEDWSADSDLEAAARDTLRRYTDWCNGNIYSVVTVDYDGSVDEHGTFGHVDYEMCGGYLGYNEAKEEL